jgi:hypothetical protein
LTLPLDSTALSAFVLCPGLLRQVLHGYSILLP